MRTVDVVVVTSVPFLVPAVTALLDHLIRQQQLSAATATGLAVMVAALVLMQIGRRGKAPA